MKKQLLILVCTLFIYSNTNGQNSDYETLTYKTKPENAESRTFLQRLFAPRSETPPTIPSERTISAKILLKGPISLYKVDQYPGKCNLGFGTKPFYFIKTPEGTFPLLHHEQSGSYIIDQPYLGMLTYSLRDWDKSKLYLNKIRLSATGYSSESLIELIKTYNTFKGSQKNK